MKLVKLSRQQPEQLFSGQGMQIPGQIQLAQDIGKATWTAGAFGIQTRAIATVDCVVVQTRGDTDDSVAGDERRSRCDQKRQQSRL